jgi:putative inorganic carbon (HCO3(-)) transporter
MARLAVGLMTLFAFAVPWEYSLDLGEPVGNIARVLGLLLLLTAVTLVLWRGTVRPPGLVQWLTLGLYLYFVLSYLWTVDTTATLEKMRGYFQVMMVVWLVWEVSESPRQLRGMMRAFVAGCWVLALLTLMNYASVAAQAAAQMRFAAEGQDPNDVARFLDLGFPLATLLFATENGWGSRMLALGYVPCGLLAVMLTASRGGFFGALAALVGSAMLLLVWRPRAASMVFLGLAMTLAVLWMFVPFASLERLATIPTQLATGDLNERLSLWTAGWHAFTRAPWFGYGAGTFAHAAGLAAADTAHNTIVAVMVTGGLVGTLLFTGILVAVCRCVARLDGLLQVALGSTMAVWAVTSMVGSVEENRMTWLLFGMMAAAARLADEDGAGLREIFSGVESTAAEATGFAIRPARPG